MLPDIIPVRFEGSQDRQAYERMVRERPELLAWLKAGADMAERFAVGRIHDGRAGRTKRDVDRYIATAIEVGLNDMRHNADAGECDEDECYVWRLGFQAIALQACDARHAPHALALGRRPLTPGDFGCS